MFPLRLSASTHIRTCAHTHTLARTRKNTYSHIIQSHANIHCPIHVRCYIKSYVTQFVSLNIYMQYFQFSAFVTFLLLPFIHLSSFLCLSSMAAVLSFF